MPKGHRGPGSPHWGLESGSGECPVRCSRLPGDRARGGAGRAGARLETQKPLSLPRAWKATPQKGTGPGQGWQEAGGKGTPPSLLALASQKVPLCITRVQTPMQIHPRWSALPGHRSFTVPYAKALLLPLLGYPLRTPAAASQDIWPCPTQSGSRRMLSRLEETHFNK